MKRGVKRVRRFSIVCLIGIVGFACSKSNPFDTPRQLAGEVFIVTAEQQTIKLPLVEVIAVPADEMRRSIESGVKKFSEQEAQFTPLSTSIKNLADKAKSKREEAETGFSNPDSPEYYYHTHNYERVLRFSSDCQRLQSKAEGFSFYLTSAEKLFRALPKPIASAKTNSEGRFEIKLPSSKPIFLCARTGRKTVDSWEFYYWMVKVDPRSSGKIDLSSDNLATTSRWNQNDSPVIYTSLESLRSELSKLENESVAIASALSNSKTKSSSPAVPKTAAAPEKRTAVLKEQVSFQLPYGNVVFAAGKEFEVLSQDASEVRVRVLGSEQLIPISAVELK